MIICFFAYFRKDIQRIKSNDLTVYKHSAWKYSDNITISFWAKLDIETTQSGRLKLITDVSKNEGFEIDYLR